MVFFTPLQLKKGMYGYPERMNELANRLDECLPNQNLSTDFMYACSHNDTGTVNSILTKTLNALLGSKDIPSGLVAFCSKCGIDISLMGLSDMNKVRKVISHRDEISERLDRAGV